MHLKLSGYKTLSTSIALGNIDTKSLEEYFKIYKWATSNGSVYDKIGLATNLI